ncbi:MAG TPA: NAD-dependent epimerase/dehydratase family protein [Acidimicrobiales bacterium]|nr:NAD-dependent epimerase/dehydratase family protein [Acidimicrobiales bacterium]
MSTTSRHVILGAGPVGRAVAARLARDGERAVVVTRSGTPVPDADTRTADVADPVAAKEALADAAVVYQCAQPAYHRWPQEFPALQAAVADAAAASGAVLVVVDNLYGYGPVAGPMTEDLPLAATTRKGATRAAMWHDLAAAHEAGRVRAVAARAADFFGPHVDGSTVGSRFFASLLAGTPVDVMGDPDARHTVTYVPDLAEAMVRLGATEDAWGRPWHVPNAPTVTQRQLVALAAEVAGVTPRVRRMAPWQLRALGVAIRPLREMVEMSYEFTEDFVVDHGAYAARFGDHATPLADALATTVAWYRGDR